MASVVTARLLVFLGGTVAISAFLTVGITVRALEAEGGARLLPAIFAFLCGLSTAVTAWVLWRAVRYKFKWR